MFTFQCKPIVVVVLLFFVAQVFLPACLAAKESVIIPAGTPVLVAFEESVRPVSAQLNQQILLHVTSVVRINGEVVIAEGATAIGQVMNMQKKGFIGRPAVMAIAVRSVEAVDGTTVVVTGGKYIEGEDHMTMSLAITIVCCLLGVLIRGGDAEIPAGSVMKVTVDAATTVKAGV